jgi:hypothetical protein
MPEETSRGCTAPCRGSTFYQHDPSAAYVFVALDFLQLQSAHDATLHTLREDRPVRLNTGVETGCESAASMFSVNTSPSHPGEPRLLQPTALPVPGRTVFGFSHSRVYVILKNSKVDN